MMLFMTVTGTSIVGTNNSTGFLIDGINMGDTYLSTTGLAVTAPLPIKLVSFEGKSTVCDQVDLSWETELEYNSDYFVVERSIDGSQFQPISKVKSQNKATGASYKYIDQELSGVTMYFYRLNQVDFDGKSEIHKIVSVSIKCPSSELSMNINPNPAIYNTSLTITGAKNPGISKVRMTNASGEEVRTFSAETDVVTEIDLTGLPAGIYQLLSTDLASPMSKRFIKID